MGNLDSEVLAAALAQHISEPEIDPDRHIRRLMIALGLDIAGKRKIYLDTRYWIYLRDAAMQRPQRPVHTLLLQGLRQAVATGVAICPVSDVILLELLKQDDSATRLATARVVDDLSSGVALINEDQRVGTEFAHLIHDLGARAGVHPIGHLVWTKSCFVLGETYPMGTSFDAATERAMQKAFIDHLWSLSMESMVRAIETALPRKMRDFEGTATRLNAANRAHSAEVRSFTKVVLDELAGVLDLYEERFADILAEVYQRREGQSLQTSEVERRNSGQIMRTVLVNLFRLKPELMCKRAPTLYVQAKCHAAVRWDKQRSLTANDLLDFHHASAGLGYCDAFFTDNPMKVLLSQRHVGLPTELGRVIVADDNSAADYIRGLMDSSHVQSEAEPN